ncbi:hypothetical protein HJB79_26250 [Rhizobium lentis]|uniref:hypothetical protein n=1 Tax=Rhizobium lentis TaxID=1138194 RepID=UPI001C83864A|nr:hypothetical protein [Rhizobium lentis]MBX5142227.1 hypothetical protein [Rhizobium lentis]MBX5153072.1 hypothetical protein [Rhizobium lentis]
MLRSIEISNAAITNHAQKFTAVNNENEPVATRNSISSIMELAFGAATRSIATLVAKADADKGDRRAAGERETVIDFAHTLIEDPFLQEARFCRPARDRRLWTIGRGWARSDGSGYVVRSKLEVSPFA